MGGHYSPATNARVPSFVGAPGCPLAGGTPPCVRWTEGDRHTRPVRARLGPSFCSQEIRPPLPHPPAPPHEGARQSTEMSKRHKAPLPHSRQRSENSVFTGLHSRARPACRAHHSGSVGALYGGVCGKDPGMRPGWFTFKSRAPSMLKSSSATAIRSRPFAVRLFAGPPVQ